MKKEKEEENDAGKNVIKEKKFTFDKASKYLSSDRNKDMDTKRVTTKYIHKESKYSGHNIESQKPNLYEIYRPKESPAVPEFIISLIAVLKHVITNHCQSIEKHVILHFDVEEDIPYIFDMAFELMGISEKVTNKYEEFKKHSSKKIFIASFRAFRGLEYPRVIVVLDRDAIGLEHYLPECLNRCTTHLHAIVIKDDTSLLKHKNRIVKRKNRILRNIISSWKTQSTTERLIKHWVVHIFGFHTNKVSERFYEISDSVVFKIHSTSMKYTDLKVRYSKKLQSVQDENTNKERIITEINTEEIQSAVAR